MVNLHSNLQHPLSGFFLNFGLCVCVHVHAHASNHRGQKNALDPLGLKLQLVVGFPKWGAGS